MLYTNSKGADQHAHLHSLISNLLFAAWIHHSTLVIPILACWIQNFKPLVSLCSWAGLFESYLAAKPKDRFSHDEAQLLAHLSRRWAYSTVYQWSVVRPSSSVVHTFKLEYLWSQLANLDQILCVASLGWGKGCIRFWGRLDQNSGFRGHRKPPLTYNEETMSPLILGHFWSDLFYTCR